MNAKSKRRPLCRCCESEPGILADPHLGPVCSDCYAMLTATRAHARKNRPARRDRCLFERGQSLIAQPPSATTFAGVVAECGAAQRCQGNIALHLRRVPVDGGLTKQEQRRTPVMLQPTTGANDPKRKNTMKPNQIAIRTVEPEDMTRATSFARPEKNLGQRVMALPRCNAAVSFLVGVIDCSNVRGTAQARFKGNEKDIQLNQTDHPLPGDGGCCHRLEWVRFEARKRR